MATGRTVKRWQRIYIDGYDLSAYVYAVGPSFMEHEAAKSPACFTDGVQGSLPGQPKITVSELKGVLDPTALTGLHARLNTGTGALKIMHLVGMRAAPVAGDPVFCGVFQQGDYKEVDEDGFSAVTIKIGDWDVNSLINYANPWGILLHANGAETGANTGSGIDCIAATSKGGWLMYQVFAANAPGATATLSVDDSANGSDWLALLDATTGSIDVGTAPVAGIIATHTDHTIRQYLRWQLALGSATSVTFALTYMRAR